MMLKIFLLLHLISSVTTIRHSLCTTLSLTVRGMDVVAASKGTVLVAVFMPLQCASCHRQLKRLSYMSSNLADVRVVVIAPYYEAPVTISRTQSEFPRLIVDRDVSNIWRIYEAANHDKIVFDRCGRVTQILSHPRSDMTANRDTLDAIDRARVHSPCGPCNSAAHDEDRLRKSSKSYQSATSIGLGHLTYRSEENPFASQHATTDVSSQTTAQYVYGPDEDYEDDLLPPVKTTPFLQTQIPSPTPFDPLWPTPAPGQFYMSDPRNPQRDESKFTAFGEQASENNIPCSAYTDDICYQQQEKFGPQGLSKCCVKGIYLTDVCIPGKCSNHTVQLCCFQKFLQARYRCCEDDNQALGPASTNNFNKCCYEHFVNEDSCCSIKLAARYWKTVHELCYPNTKVDYSGIKLEWYCEANTISIRFFLSRNRPSCWWSSLNMMTSATSIP
ncbi:hypothetical protein KIN20_035606 [Parelaphostrongylus tenuis]|uniref:Selenoprotein P N-terminal domain-containing protein n=1 Tax=Parelaphostrongylus tenuis TaxID=148309 RepID=A0AAD5RBZ7_PARTN|nr:hypothetical protein KIN20_035606 [Parelaphostrongylus tenuis]